RRPLHVEATSPFFPLLINDAFERIAAAFEEHPAWDIPEPLIVIRPAQSSGELHLWCDLIIGLAKPCKGVKTIRILAAEVIVTLPIERADRVGIDISSGKIGGRRTK